MDNSGAGIQPHPQGCSQHHREPGGGVEKAKCDFRGQAGLSNTAPIDTVEAAGLVMGPFHPPKASSDFWAATQIVPKVLILLRYRGA